MTCIRNADKWRVLAPALHPAAQVALGALGAPCREPSGQSLLLGELTACTQPMCAPGVSVLQRDGLGISPYLPCVCTCCVRWDIS